MKYSNLDYKWDWTNVSPNSWDKLQGIAFDPSGDVVFAGVYDSSVNLGNGGYVALGSNDMFVGKFAGNDGSFIWELVTDWSINNADARAITTDSSGNVYVTGYSEGNDLGGGAFDGSFVLKLTGAGAWVWQYVFDLDPDYALGENIAVDSSGNAYILGYTYSTDGGYDFGGGERVHYGINDHFLLKVNSDGTYGWDYGAGSAGGSEYSYDIELDSAGNIYCTGVYTGEIDFGGGIRAANPSGWESGFVVKLDSNGNYIWDQTFVSDATGVVKSYGLAISDDGLFSTGHFLKYMDLGGGETLSTNSWNVFMINFSID